jgi:hypothetical protein
MAEDEMDEESSEDIQNDNWLKSNFIDLMQKYPREWIAVLEMKVIANSNNRPDVIEKADAIAGEKEYSIYFIPATGTVTDIGYSHK